jgi:large subunit ribosomal protein L13e
MKHNQVIANQHFRKDWKRRIKCWFNQPARKLRRRNTRAAKAKVLAPRPLHRLRPIVQCHTKKYSSKARAGKGFTLDELQAANIRRKEAKGIGIAVDHRRRNLSEEGFNRNVERLKAYKKRLVVFPRNPSTKKKGVERDDSKSAKAGSCSRNTMRTATFATIGTKRVLAIETQQPRLKPRAITKADTEGNVHQTIRKARHVFKFQDQWRIAAEEKASKQLKKKK